MARFIIQLTQTDNDTYHYIESIPLIASDKEEAELIISEQIKRPYRCSNPHKTLGQLHGVKIEDVELLSLDEFFEFI